MRKLLFFDYWELEEVKGFARRLQQPVKHSANPLFTADLPWENGNMQLYGSVVKAPGKPFQLWYSTIEKPWNIRLGYAESDDGFAWRRPELEVYAENGRKTNLVLTCDVHGPAVIYDDREPDPVFRYKMVAGIAPTGMICVLHSGDGIQWHRFGRYPVITTDPDCPMGFFRARDGRYVCFHRVSGRGRRVFRSESWDLKHWSGEPRMVLEPNADDDEQTQFYGFGAAPYGGYEIGTLWIFHTDPAEIRNCKMRGWQDAELTYARSGYAVHRAAQRISFIPHGGPASWERGNLQVASQPVFLDGEIRYYYMGSTELHDTRWELNPQTAGIGCAGLKPDRFVALEAGADEARLLTLFWGLLGTRLCVNADVAEEGYVKVELTDANGLALPGFEAAACIPMTGDSTAHDVRWKDADLAHLPAGQVVRFRLLAKKAKVFSVFNLPADEKPVYHQFSTFR